LLSAGRPAPALSGWRALSGGALLLGGALWSWVVRSRLGWCAPAGPVLTAARLSPLKVSNRA